MEKEEIEAKFSEWFKKIKERVVTSEDNIFAIFDTKYEGAYDIITEIGINTPVIYNSSHVFYNEDTAIVGLQNFKTSAKAFKNMINAIKYLNGKKPKDFEVYVFSKNLPAVVVISKYIGIIAPKVEDEN